MADGLARSPYRLCSRDGKISCYGDALSTIFLLACFCVLLPTFRFSFFFSFLIFFPASRYVYLLRVPSYVQQSATLSKYVFYSTCSFCLCHLYPTPFRNYFVFLFERSEFLIATCEKKKLTVCVCVCVCSANRQNTVYLCLSTYMVFENTQL